MSDDETHEPGTRPPRPSAKIILHPVLYNRLDSAPRQSTADDSTHLNPQIEALLAERLRRLTSATGT